MVLVREDVVLQRQERAAGIDQVDDAEAVLGGDVLGTHVLLDTDRQQRAALHRCVVGDEHPRHAADHADTGDDARAGGAVVVHLPARQRGELQERRAGIADQVDPVPRQDLAAAVVALDGALTTRTAGDGELLPLPQRREQVGIGSRVLLELGAAGVDAAFELSHLRAVSLSRGVSVAEDRTGRAGA